MPQYRLTACVVLLLLGPAAGCFQPPPPSPDPTDGGALPELTVRLEAFDGWGEPRPLYALSQRPELHLFLPEGSSPEVYLFEGAPSEGEWSDLTATPATQQTKRRARNIETLEYSSHLAIRPVQPLIRGAAYSLVIPAWTTGADAPAQFNLLTTDRTEDGAELLDSWPADGAHGVSAAAPDFALRFSGPVQGFETGVLLLREDGSRVRVSATTEPCDELGWSTGRCIAIRSTHPLDPVARYRIRIGENVLDGSGARVGPIDIAFQTGQAGALPLRALPLECYVDETPIALNDMGDESNGCLVHRDTSLLLRARFSAAVRVSWRGPTLVRQVAHQGEVQVRLGALAADTSFTTELSAVSSDGGSFVSTLSVRTDAPFPALVISEVRGDPLGVENANEYVEVWNYGTTAVELAGFALSDSPSRFGDEVPSTVLSPDERVLVVTSAFVPESDRDVPTPPGVRLLRVDSTLGSGGIHNQGEPLYLRDSLNRRVSTFPSARVDHPGRCLVLTSRPQDVASATSGDCTPGRP